jgi:hypothetical protein
MRFSLKLAQSAQPGERQSKFSTERQKFWSSGHFWVKKPPKGISNQNTLLNNFSHVQPILTRNTPTYSAQLAEARGSLQNFCKPLLKGAIGEFQKSSPLNNFWNVRRIFTSNIHRSIQQNKGNKMKSSNLSKFHSWGAREQFLSKTPLLNNFLTVRPIFTINIPIDSGWQEEKVDYSKSSKFTAMWAIRDTFCENTPKNNLLANEPIFTNDIYRSI